MGLHKLQLVPTSGCSTLARSVRKGGIPLLSPTGLAARIKFKTLWPTNAAARCQLPRVMSRFGSSIRSTCERLVFNKTATFALEIFFFFMACPSFQATTSLTACACVSSRMPSSFRKSSMLDPICLRVMASTPFAVCGPTPILRLGQLAFFLTTRSPRATRNIRAL